MGGPLVMAAVLVLLTHGFRALGRLAGPRRVGLAMGLPCTTAVLLVGSGCEHGVGYAIGMAESSLLGLAAAVVLPLTYARTVARGDGWPQGLTAAVAGYVAAAWLLGSLATAGAGVGIGDEFGHGGRLVLATAAVLAAWLLVSRIRVARAAQGPAAASPARVLTLRTVVPLACLGAVLGMRDAVGPEWAGLLSTFPGMTLALLVVTHLESGPAEACRLARALPPGNLAMIAFLAIFRYGGPAVGLGWATACGYAAALAALLVVDHLTRRGEPTPAPPSARIPRPTPTLPLPTIRRHAPQPPGPRPVSFFAPRLEAIL